MKVLETPPVTTPLTRHFCTPSLKLSLLLVSVCFTLSSILNLILHKPNSFGGILKWYTSAIMFYAPYDPPCQRWIFPFSLPSVARLIIFVYLYQTMLQSAVSVRQYTDFCFYWLILFLHSFYSGFEKKYIWSVHIHVYITSQKLHLRSGLNGLLNFVD